MRRNRREAGRASMSATALDDSLARGDFPEAAAQAVRIAPHDEAFTPPSVDGGLRDVESLRDFAGRKQAAPAQPLMAARKFVGCTNESDFLQVEGLALPGFAAEMVEEFGDLAITVFIEKPVDFGDQLWLELADLSDWQGPIQRQGARGSARQAHVGGNRL